MLKKKVKKLMISSKEGLLYEAWYLAQSCCFVFFLFFIEV